MSANDRGNPQGSVHVPLYPRDTPDGAASSATPTRYDQPRHSVADTAPFRRCPSNDGVSTTLTQARPAEATGPTIPILSLARDPNVPNPAEGRAASAGADVVGEASHRCTARVAAQP